MELKNRGKSKALYVLLSIVVAIVIWTYADSDQKTLVEKTYADLPIEYTSEETILADRGLMLLEDSSSTVTLNVQAVRSVIAQLDPADINISVDLSSVTETGWQSLRYTVSYGSVNPSSVTVKNSTYMTTVHIGELYSKTFDVRCEVQGQVASDYIAGEVSCQPKTVEIRGDQAAVDQISYVKVVLQVEDAKSAVTQTLECKLYDEQDQEIELTSNIRTTVSRVQVTLPVYRVKELPLTVDFTESPGFSADNIIYTIQPSSITVSGDAAQLDSIDSIVLENDFDLSALSLSGETTYNYVVTVPSGCENLSGITRATMKIRWKDMTTRTFAVTNFNAAPLPDGKTASVLTSALNVTLRGTSADLNSLTAADIMVTADLTDVSGASGSYTVPAYVTVNGDVDLATVEDYQLQVNIRDTVDEEEAET